MITRAIQFILCLACSLSFVVELQAENPCGTMFPRGEGEYWGVGAYLLLTDFEVTLYQSKNENEDCGKLVNKKGFLQLVDHYKKGQQFEHSDIEWIGSYTNILLKVYAEEGRFVRVLDNSFTGGLFIKKRDLQQYSELYTYADFLFWAGASQDIKQIRKGINVGINLTKSCLNLRELAKIDAKKINCISANVRNSKRYTSLTIKSQIRNWMEVEVETYGYKDDDTRYTLISKESGWLKAIDENGFPNIWFSVNSLYCRH